MTTSRMGARALAVGLAAATAWMPTVSSAVVILQETFESEFPTFIGWAVRDANNAGTPAWWGGVPSAFGGEGTHGGSWKGYCAGQGYAGTTNAPLYRSDMRAQMFRNLDLRTYSAATLTYWYKIPSIDSGHDYFNVYYGADRIDYTSFPQAGWAQRTVDLSAYAGPGGTVRNLMFEFTSDGSIAAEGVYLDDIVVNATRPAADGYEADDSFGTARRIANRTPQDRSIHLPGNADWVRFNVGPYGARNLVLETLPTFPSGPGDTEMWLYRGSGSELAYDADAGDGSFSRITMPALTPGSYYIKIQEQGNNGFVPAYRLVATWADLWLPDAYEADDSIATAKAIANGVAQTRSIHDVGNQDVASFRIGSGGARNVRVALDSDPVYTEMQMWLTRGSTGELLGYAAPMAGEREINLDSLTAGTYFVRIREFGNDGTIRTYALRVNWTPGSVSTGDAFEPDGSAAEVRAIANGVAQNRSIHEVGDVDFARFVVGAGGARNVRIETAGASGDTQLWLYRGSTGVEEGYDGDSGIGAFSRITLDALPAGTHYIKVQENGNNGTVPAYTLRATWTSP